MQLPPHRPHAVLRLPTHEERGGIVSLGSASSAFTVRWRPPIAGAHPQHCGSLGLTVMQDQGRKLIGYPCRNLMLRTKTGHTESTYLCNRSLRRRVLSTPPEGSTRR